MKRTLLQALFCCISSAAMAQGMFGGQAGVGFTTSYESKKTPAFEGYYLHKVSNRFYAGGSLFFQKYSLYENLNTGPAINYGDVVSINQKSSYLFLSPKIDFGIGYRKYFHVYATFGPGLYMGGKQLSNTHSPYWTTGGGSTYGADTIAVNTTYNVPGAIFRYGFGVMERIPTRGYWNITFTQEFGGMPGGLSKGPHSIQPSYFCFTIGVMHKYPLVFVEY